MRPGSPFFPDLTPWILSSVGEALRRIATNTVEKRLLNDRGEPNFDIQFYVVDASGTHAGVSMRPRARYAVCTENGAALTPCDALLSS